MSCMESHVVHAPDVPGDVRCTLAISVARRREASLCFNESIKFSILSVNFPEVSSEFYPRRGGDRAQSCLCAGTR